MSAPPLDIIALATAHATSYASALSRSPTLTEWAQALSSHYLPGTTSFTCGQTTTMGPDPVKNLMPYLAKLDEAFGRDFRTVNTRVERVGERSVVVWMTFELRPKDGSEWIVWTNLYGFRVFGGRKKGWEYTVADGEIEALSKRSPGMFGGVEA
jgi:hypothetical protein